MNRMQKIVFSRSLKEASWQNTRLVKGDLVAEMRRLKSEPGPDMVIFGSGTIVAQLTQAGLIDEFQLIVNPLALGSGRTLFEGVEKPIRLELKSSRAFRNGNILLNYEPA